ncbi:MAG: GH3 family domain-containing protein, partial [Chryseobacterium culicis]
MLNFFKKNAALIWAKKHVQKAEDFKKNAEKNQEDLLISLVNTAQKTLFGREHDFENIHSVKEFQDRVPVADYEDLKPYIERVKKGQSNILWTETPEYFAKTSGTTSGSKYIPISKEGMPFQIAGAQSALFHYISKKNNADFVNGKMIFLQGSPELEEVFGIKTGRLSGIVAHHIPNYLQKNRLPSWETNIMEDWESKVDKIIEETEHENMTLISGIPPWLIMYFEKLSEKHGKKIKQLFPNLQLIVTGGVNYEPYRDKMEELLGGTVDIVQTFPASEGFFAFQDDYTKEGLLLLTNHGIFYEFIPLEEYGKPGARRLTLKEIELHKDYALILTTNSGLWAYSIGDVVRFISKDPYRVLVSGRTKHFTSAFGEHVIAFEVEEAMKAALEKYPAQITEFHLAPQV